MGQRLHVVIHLPNDHPAEAEAYWSVLAYIAKTFPGEGYTLVKRVEGYWVALDGESVIKDYSTLYVTDIPLPTKEAQSKIATQLQEIRRFALDAYRAAGRPQDEIWITTQFIMQHGALEGFAAESV